MMRYRADEGREAVTAMAATPHKTPEKEQTGRAHATRDLIVATAERLFAEHGVNSVSNRQIGAAAGQGNTTAVSYHFATKADLIRAILRKHDERIDVVREAMVADAAGSTDARDWIACLVVPPATHLAGLGTPTWFGRFGAQVATDPAHRRILREESFNSPSTMRAVTELDACVSGLPPRVQLERRDMARQLMVHGIAERERALAEGTATPRNSWAEAANGLTDALVGLWLAPVTG
ncbi:regulatory protein, tetR family [Prauserella marina]|uniref:Regulatory protein, tetR family n=2 Tax=Prauserella marina TaxID=530584 RepID=A0A1G6VYV9_9PSEU|nr:TetR family transcriptional regulator [Prauserella marina]SDD58900.1 regulatory protein, tetR family [Prauserella marina]